MARRGGGGGGGGSAKLLISNLDYGVSTEDIKVFDYHNYILWMVCVQSGLLL